MRFRLAALSLLVLSAGCGKDDGKTFTVRTRLLSPVDVSDPLAGLSAVRLRVWQGGEIRGERTFAPDAPWKIPSGADPGDEIVLRIDGLDATGAVVRTGGTRPLVPDESKGRTFGVFFSAPGEFAEPPSYPAVFRSDADTIALPDGRTVSVGGYDDVRFAMSSVSLYDPDEGTWRELAPLSVARIAPGIAVLPDGLALLVAGGIGAGDAELDSTEIYRVPAIDADAEDNGSTTGGPVLPTTWSGMQLGRLTSGKIVIAGGYSATGAPGPAVFDPAGPSITPLEGGVFASAASVTETGDGRVAIVGGDSPETASRVDVVAEDTNGTVSLSTGVGVLRVSRRGASAISIGAGRVLVTGGEVPTGGITAGVEVVDLTGGAPSSTLVERERVRRTVRPIERLGDGRVLLAGGVDPVGGATNRAFVFDPATNHVEEVGSLPDPIGGRRYTAPLPDGTVLFVGGDASGAVRIFQPPVEPLSGADRVDLAITVVEGQRAAGGLLDGVTQMRARFFDGTSAVLEAGGLAAGSTVTVPGIVADDDVYIVLEGLDASGGVLAWGATSAPVDQPSQQSGVLTLLVGRVGEFVLAPSSLPTAHRDGAAIQLADGRVAVACGLGGPLVTDVFDPGNGATAELNATIPAGRRDVRAVILPGALFVVSGLNGAGTPVTNASLLDTVTGTWSSAAALAPAREKHAVVRLANGSVIAHGDAAAMDGTIMPGDVWNGTTWSPVVVQRKRSHHRGVLLGDDDVLFVGGITTNGAGTVISSTAETYDAMTQVFTPTAGNMATARRDHAAFATNGDAVVCGGIPTVAASPAIASCERYNRATRTFSAAGSLSAPRDDSAVVTLASGETWVIGGGGGNTGLSLAATDIWDGAAIGPGPSLSIPRATAAAIELRDGRIVVAGGFDQAGATQELSSVELHTPPTWTNPFGY